MAEKSPKKSAQKSGAPVDRSDASRQEGSKDSKKSGRIITGSEKSTENSAPSLPSVELVLTSRVSILSVSTLADDQFDGAKQGGLILGQLSQAAQFHRPYLLPLHSQAISKIVNAKERYRQIAVESAAELELTRLIATMIDRESPKYMLIELRSVTLEALNGFEQQLLQADSNFAEKLPYDPYKYVCVQAARNTSLFVTTSDDERHSDGSAEDSGTAAIASNRRKKFTKKAGEGRRKS